MKKAIYSVIGAIFMGSICIVVTWAIGAIFGPLYTSEDESTRNFKIFFIAFIISIVTGLVSGFMYARHRS